MGIGANIKKFRQLRKKTAAEMSREMKVSRQTYYKWEGDLKLPRPGMIERLAVVLGVSEQELRHGTGRLDDELIDIQRRLIDVQSEQMASMRTEIDALNKALLIATARKKR